MLAGERAEPLAALADRIRLELSPEPRLADAVVLRRVLRTALRALPPGDEDPQIELSRADSEQGARALAALWRALQILRGDAIAPATLDHPRVLAVAPGAPSLSRALGAYVGALAARGITDRPGALAHLAEAIARAAPERCAELVGARVVELRGVLALSAAECAWLAALDRALARLGGGVRVVLPALESRLDAARAPDALEPLVELTTAWLDAPVLSEPVASPLGDRWLGGEQMHAADCVEALLGADADAQSRLTVRAVVAAVEQGASLDRIVIAYPGDAGRDAIDAIVDHLADAGVAAHAALPLRVDESPMLKFAFDVAAEGKRMDRREVARLIRSTYVDARALLGARDGEGGVARGVVSEVAKRLERRRPSEAATVEQSLLDLAGAEGEPSAAERRTALGRFLSLLALPSEASTARQQVAALRRVWGGLNLPARAASGGLDLFAHDGSLSEAKRRVRAALVADARAWDALVRALDRFEMALEQAGAGGESLSVEALLVELRALVEAESRTPRAGRVGALRIVPLADVADDALDLLVVVEAGAHAIPSAGGGDPLASDALRAEALRVERREQRLGPGAVRRARDLATLARAAARAARVVLVARTLDGEGGALDPAPVLVALRTDADAATEMGLLGVLTTPIGARERSVARARLGGATDVLADVAERARRERVREEYFLDATRATSVDVGSLVDTTDVRAQLLAATGGADEALSVSRVDVVATCPFRGFSALLLRADRRAHESDVPDARDTGTLVHAALFAAFEAIRPLLVEEPRDEARLMDLASSAIEGSLAPLGREGARGLQRERIVEDALAVVRAAVADREWVYLLGEQPFGEASPSSWGPLVLDAPSGPIKLRGRVDRIDEARGRRALRVIDYKRTVAPLPGLGVTSLQLPLYVRVVARERACDATGRFLGWQRRRGSSEPLPDAVESKVRESIAPGAGGVVPVDARVASVVEALRAGAIAPVPHSEAQCSRCDVSGVCRRPRFAIRPDASETEVTE